MKIEEAAMLLKEEGHYRELVWREDELSEVMTYPEDDCYFIRKEGEAWSFYHVLNERRNEPEYQTEGTFSSEEEAARAYLLNRLHSTYLNKYILPAQKANEFSKKRSTMDFGDLESAMTNTGIPREYISYGQKKEGSIFIFEEADGWHAAFIAEDGTELLKSIPETKARCITMAFTRIYYLYLLKKLTDKCLERKLIEKPFDTAETVYFLKGRK